MELDTWLAFAAASAVILILPGPTIVMVLSLALGQGRRVALASVAGVALGDFLAMGASLAGLGALIATSATAFQLLKWAGAAYLVWLGLRMLATAGTGSAMPPPGAPGFLPARAAFRATALVTALNPKPIAFFIAFVPQFIRPEAPLAPQFGALIATFVTLGALNALAWALAGNALRARLAGPSARLWLARGGGATLVALGLTTATFKRATP